jgi:hypothetical protein
MAVAVDDVGGARPHRNRLSPLGVLSILPILGESVSAIAVGISPRARQR